MTKTNWQDNYNEAREFYLAHGHFPTFTENRRLRQWAVVWEHKQGAQEPEKLRMLQNIGYDSPDKWSLWDSHYRAAEQVYRQTGAAPTLQNCRQAVRYFTLWVLNSSHLHPDRLKKLRSIGLAGGAGSDIWQRNYKEARDFFLRHGRFPSRGDNIRLAVWARQWATRHGGTDPDRLRLLQDIGFDV